MVNFHVYEVEATGEKDVFIAFGAGETGKRNIEKDRGNIRIIKSFSWNEVKEILLKKS